MGVIEDVLAFDGRDTAGLRRAVQGGVTDEDLARVVALCGPENATHGNATHRRAASWVIKTHLKRGRPMPRPLTERFLKAAILFETWDLQLHALQSVRYLTIPDGCFDALLAFVHGCRKHRRLLVRVWALDAYVCLSADRASLRPGAARALKAALDAARSGEAPPSMGTRARKLAEEFPTLIK